MIESLRSVAEGATLPIVPLVERERRVLGQIAAGVPLADVLRNLLRAVEAQSGRRLLTSVLFVSDDGRHLLHGAAPSLPAAYNEAVHGIAIGEGVGSCGTAAARNAPVYVGDIADDPLWAEFRDVALANGLRACWSTPIRAADGGLLGTFAIYYREPRLPTAADIAAIGLVTQTAALAIARHLSDRVLRRSEEALKGLNEALAQQVAVRTQERDRLWTLSRDPLLITDRRGVWLSVSPVLSELLGWSDAEMVGRTSEWMEHPEDRVRSRGEVATLAAGKLTNRFEQRLRTRRGDYRIFSWTAVPDGDFFYCVARDMTVERAQEAALARTQDALRQAQKMDAVGQLTGGIAHDFNNLLAGISASLELMQMRLTQGRHGDLERYVAAAQGATLRAAALTSRLLSFSRRQTLMPRATDVNRLVAGMEELVRRTVGPGIAIEVAGATGLWAARVDPHQLENALLNLCINARDAMSEGGRITIATANRWFDADAAARHDMPAGHYLSLTVTDTGTGMTPEVIAKAFEPFFTTKPPGEGTGLGLSMVYGFARQSGGQVRVYSAPGEGTTICLYLPRHDGAADEDDAPPAAAAARRGAHEGTVLVVDDEPTVRMTIVEMLNERGYLTIEAADAAAGLKILESDARIDLLVTDIGLPGGMNGRQMADAGRAGRPGLKMLFITGYAETALPLDPDVEVVAKPFAVDALSARVEALIGS